MPIKISFDDSASFQAMNISNKDLNSPLESLKRDTNTFSIERGVNDAMFLSAIDLQRRLAWPVAFSLNSIENNNTPDYLLKIQDSLALNSSIVPARLSYGLFQGSKNSIEKSLPQDFIELSQGNKEDEKLLSSFLKNKKLRKLIENFFEQLSEEELDNFKNNKLAVSSKLRKKIETLMPEIKKEIAASTTSTFSSFPNEIAVKKTGLITLCDSITKHKKDAVGIEKEFLPPLKNKVVHLKSDSGNSNKNDFFYVKNNKKIDEVIEEKLAEIKFNLKYGNPEEQQKYRSGLEEYLNFISRELPQYKALCDKVRAFYVQESALFFTHHNRLSVSFRILELILYPSSIDQGHSYLCGIASFFSVLAHAIPSELIDMCLEFAETGQIGKPLLIQATFDSKEKEDDIIQLFMHSLKNAINKTGYNNLSQFEVIQGVTRPKQIVTLLNKFGFTNITESMVLQTPSKQPVSSLHNLLLGGLYSNVHVVEKDKEKSLNILSHNLARGQTAIILLSAPGKPILGVEMAHYVYLSKLEFHNDEIHIETETYGEKSTDVYSKEEFFSIYLGAICATPSQMGHRLQIEQAETNENYLLEGHILNNKF